MNSPLWVYLLGLAGMGIYGSRILIQWYMSEKSKRVESPGIYWILSSVGAVILYIYGWLRKDFSIIFGESVGYYAYMWNISILGLYKKVSKPLIVLQAVFPILILALIIKDLPTFTETFLHNKDVPLKLLLFGVLGQTVYESRSIYQLVYSYRRKTSILPTGHWILAVIGSLMIIIYGLIRHDWVLAIGQFSIFFSIRNLMISISSSKRKTTKLLMVRPVRFGYNFQTAGSNKFQNEMNDKDSQALALTEFNGMVRLLEEKDIPLIVVDDTPEPETCDSIFPNNWFSTHEDGTLVLYPMLAPNRRAERDPKIITTIMEESGIKKVLDLSVWEEKGKFLEGTGSMVLDRKNRIVYACRSPRTSEIVLDEFCRKEGYRPIVFDALDKNGNPVYHTNVVMSIGSRFAVLCKDVIISPPELSEIESSLTASGKTVVGISFEQMCNFAGTILEVKNIRGENFVVMSQTAKDSFSENQLAVIGKDCTILPVSIPTIESVGGGSARCMLAEVLCRNQ